MSENHNNRDKILLEYTEKMAQTGTWELDLTDNSIYWSDGVYRMVGDEPQSYPVDFNIGLNVIHPDDREKALAEMNAAISEGKDYNITKRFLLKDGTIKHISSRGTVIKDESGQPMKLIGVFQDITETNSLVEQLRLSNERFEKVTQATNDAIWDFDVTKNQLQWGKGFLTQFGYDPDVTKPSFEFLLSKIHHDDRDRVFGRIQEYMQNPEKVNWFEEYQFEKSDGTIAFVIDRAVFIRDGNGQVIRVVGAMTDISYRKVMEDSLRTLNHQLEDHARELALSNKELEQFAYVTSHDLQEPLRMINSFLVLLQKKYGDKLDPKAQQYIHFATDGALRMRQIILDLLEFSRVGVHLDRIESVDFNEIFNEVKSLQRRKIEESKADVSSDKLPIIDTYRSPIIQVFHNLIGNALKYAEPSRRPKIQVSFEDHKDHLKFMVIDNGIGINSEYHDKIFIIFQRLHTKESYSGTGMGLAIVKKIVENMGGAVGVESVPGEGSTFWFTIPK